MTQEEKQLLLKDLSARLPYNVICHANEINLDGELLFINKVYSTVALYNDNATGKFNTCPITDVKPYLRPLSSVTNEECRQLFMLLPTYFVIFPESIYAFNNSILPEHIEIITDFYNSHYIDWRGLIPKGLALEASENMYKTN